MFNPERILGGLIRGGMRRKSGTSSLITSGAALGLVGIAMEAVEHYMNRSTAAPSMPPPVPGGTAQGGRSAPPPPPPPLPTAVNEPSPARQAEAVLLIRAMIAAAYADGAVDERERAAIMQKLMEMALSNDEQQFVISELLAPKNIKSIVSAVASPEMARQVYLASLLSIEVDTDAERDYLKALARELALDPTVVAQIHRQLGLPMLA